MENFLDKISKESGIYINTNPSLVKGLLKELFKQFKTFKDIAKYFKTDEKGIRNWIKKGNFPLKLLIEMQSDNNFNKKIIPIKNKIRFLSVQASRHKVKIPELTTDIAYLAGYISGDGHLKNPEKAKKWEIIIEAWKDKKNLRKCRDILKKHFGINAPISKNNTRKGWRLFINSKIVFLYFSKIFNIPCGNKSSTIKVPEIISKNGTEIKKAYISGWLNAEGFLTRSHGLPQFEFYVKNEYVSNWIKETIENMGIKMNKNKKGTLIIYSGNVPKFLSFFKFGDVG